MCAGKGGSMHIADLLRGMLGANAIVGGSPPLVIGAALTAKTLKSDRVAVAFTGDGGSNQGTIFEAMNMAVVLQLPALFVIENNGYGEGTGVRLRGRREGSRAARSRLRHARGEGGRQRFLRSLRGNGRCSDSRAGRRRSEFHRGSLRSHPRTLLRRSTDLPLQGRVDAGPRSARSDRGIPSSSTRIR